MREKPKGYVGHNKNPDFTGKRKTILAYQDIKLTQKEHIAKLLTVAEFIKKYG